MRTQDLHRVSFPFDLCLVNVQGKREAVLLASIHVEDALLIH